MRGDGLSAASRAEMTKPSLHIATAHQFPPFAANLPAGEQRKDLAAGLGGRLRGPGAIHPGRYGGAV